MQPRATRLSDDGLAMAERARGRGAGDGDAGLLQILIEKLAKLWPQRTGRAYEDAIASDRDLG